MRKAKSEYEDLLGSNMTGCRDVGLGRSIVQHRKNSEAIRGSRKARSWTAIVEAFSRLSLAGRKVTSPVALAREAGVSRATLYSAFGNMNAVAMEAISPVIDEIASGLACPFDERRLAAVLNHIWVERCTARRLLASRARFDALIRLEGAIEQHVRFPGSSQTQAVFFAAGVLHVLERWLLGRLRGSPSELARQLRTFFCAASIS